jgi:hypothetical protein
VTAGEPAAGLAHGAGVPLGWRVGVLHWRRSDGVSDLFVDVIGRLGCDPVSVLHGEALPNGLDAIFVHGPQGSLVPLANQLAACPPAERPRLALLLTEQLPDPALPEWLRRGGGALRSRFGRLIHRKVAPGVWQIPPALRSMPSRATRFRYYGDLFWLQDSGLLDVLAVGSRWTVRYLRERGIRAEEVYTGAHPSWGADLGLDRDVEVLWLGKRGGRRRSRLLDRVRAELAARGVEMLVVDGVENRYIFGEERTELLNRTRIALNLLRAPWDNNAFRFYMASLNRVALVSEPMLPHLPWQPGVHLVEAELDSLAETICYYLRHEDERRQLAENAHRLVTSELTMTHSVDKILRLLAASRERA